MSESNTHLAALRAESLPFRIEEFINFRVLDIANNTLVPAIKKQAVLKKMPDRYINSIKAEFDGSHLWIWVDFKGKKGEPLDVFFEKGTKKHFIKPKAAKALSWIVGGFVKAFSKGHYVSGIKARYVFRDGFLKGYPEFKKKLQEELEEYTKETMLFGR